jgi:hypothetical protein
VEGIDQGRSGREAVASKALWEDLAVKARGLHCPEHHVGPWRIVVLGETRETMRLHIYGCCDRLGRAINEMIAADPRIAGPR